MTSNRMASAGGPSEGGTLQSRPLAVVILCAAVAALLGGAVGIGLYEVAASEPMPGGWWSALLFQYITGVTASPREGQQRVEALAAGLAVARISNHLLVRISRRWANRTVHVERGRTDRVRVWLATWRVPTLAYLLTPVYVPILVQAWVQNVHGPIHSQQSAQICVLVAALSVMPLGLLVRDFVVQWRTRWLRFESDSVYLGGPKGEMRRVISVASREPGRVLLVTEVETRWVSLASPLDTSDTTDSGLWEAISSRVQARTRDWAPSTGSRTRLWKLFMVSAVFPISMGVAGCVDVLEGSRLRPNDLGDIISVLAAACTAVFGTCALFAILEGMTRDVDSEVALRTRDSVEVLLPPRRSALPTWATTWIPLYLLTLVISVSQAPWRYAPVDLAWSAAPSIAASLLLLPFLLAMCLEMVAALRRAKLTVRADGAYISLPNHESELAVVSARAEGHSLFVVTAVDCFVFSNPVGRWWSLKGSAEMWAEWINQYSVGRHPSPYRAKPPQDGTDHAGPAVEEATAQLGPDRASTTKETRNG